jgi:serine/threonine protein kinase/tetratricopeptide (TPR) repeat protein
LADDASTGGQTAPSADESTLTAGAGFPQNQFTARPGDRFGPYKVLEEIGQGGCGAVFIAEQEQPVRRRVALKVIKLGMDTRQVIARFEAERQALAMMDHPNIARVLDAGSTDTGRPFFVMELVRGIKITDYCDQHKLSTTDRLKLFIQICQAVQHAHQKGIIHRDLKPSNILVTLQDDVPTPKVIDFGVAKATANQKLTDKTVYTALEQFIGTPAYMSPEQAEMVGLDIDTRSDIYSLGVLLYELLVGETPFSSEELLSVGLDAMRRTLREKDPAKPSTKLNTMTQADLTAIAQHRQSEPPKLIKLVRGDLDWIVMKCLEKDRSRRYETANGLAMDIQRHLSNEPVVARPQSRLYRFQKVVGRNRAAFAAAAAFAGLLIVGILVSTSEAVRATRAEREQSRLRQDAVASRDSEARLRAEAQANEQKAKTEALKSEQVANFMKGMLQTVSPSVALGRDTTLVREVLDKTARRLDELKNQPLIEAELRNTIGEVYLALGDANKAEAMQREALALQRKTMGTENLDTATSLYDLARALHERKNAESESLHREALAIRRKLLGNESPDVAASLDNLSRALRCEGKFAEAEAMQREALAIRRKAFGEQDADVATSLHNLANVLSDQNNLAEAENMHREALAIRRKLFGSEHPDVASSIYDLARVLRSERKLVEAEILQREALAVRRKLLGNDHVRVADSLEELSYILLLEKNFSGAESVARECLAIKEGKVADTYREFVARSLLGGSLLGEKNYSEAEPLLVSGYEGMKQRETAIPAENKPLLSEALRRLVDLYEQTQRSEQAAECKKELAHLDKPEK